MAGLLRFLLALCLAFAPTVSASETLAELTARGRGGDIDAMVELGYRYLHGLGVERDLTESRRWFEVPVYTAQLPYAMTWMGLAYLQEDAPSEADLAQALGFFRDAVDYGDQEADIYLGWMIGNGLATTVDREQGRRYIIRAMRNDIEGAGDWLRRLEASPIPDIRIVHRGCEITFRDQETLEYWDSVGRLLGHPTPPDLHRFICTTTENRPATIVDYLGYEEQTNRYFFQTRFDDCDMQFQVRDTGTDYRYSMAYDQTCHLYVPPRSNARPNVNPLDLIGGLFSLGGEMLFGGAAALSGVSREELAETMRNQDSRCFLFSDNEDAMNACLGRPHLIENDNAQNILLGFCHLLSDWAESNGLDYLCTYPGRDSCHRINDSDHAYACYACGGTRMWAAMYAAGSVMMCYD
jgi:hypothetical protein